MNQMNNKVKNEKKVLWIAPQFHNYYNDFNDEFSEWENVTIDTPLPHSFFVRKIIFSEFLNRVVPVKKVINNYKESCFKKMIERVCRTQYDVVVIIKATMDYKYIETLRRKQPSAKFVLYEWDSVCFYNYLNLVDLFDRIVTFDIEDSKKYKFEYLPLFYTNNYSKIAQEETAEDIDVFYLGAAKDRRLDQLKKIASELSKRNINYCFNIVSNNSDLGISGANVYKNPLSFDQFHDSYARSKAILEIARPNQNGLSIRVIEAVGARKKIIIDSDLIKQEPFYSKKNVFIINEDDLNNIKDFINSDTDYRVEEYDYSIRAFAKALIN